MFIKDYSFRYSDRNNNGDIKTSTVLDLLQDISVAHTDAVGLSPEKMLSMSVACLLEGWRIRFDEPLVHDKAVTVKTGIMAFHRCESIRKYEIWQEGRCKIIATAVWFTVNTDEMKIIRIPEALSSAYENPNEEDNGLKYVKLRAENDAEFSKEITVEKRDLDTNNHMNNVKSVEAAFNFLPDGFSVTELRIKYCKELKKDERIKVSIRHSENEFYCDLKNENDEVCVLINAYSA